MAAAAKTAGRSRTWLWLAGFALIAAAAIVYMRHRTSAGVAAQTYDDSGTPGPNQAPNLDSGGGGASGGGSLQPIITGQPQGTNDQGSGTTAAATASTPDATPTAPTVGGAGGYYSPSGIASGTTSQVSIGGTTYEQTAPGSDYYAPTPTQSSAASNAHKPGLQI